MPQFTRTNVPHTEATDGAAVGGSASSRRWLAQRPRVESLLWATPYTIFLIVPLVGSSIELLNGDTSLLLPVLLMFALLITYLISWLLTDVAPTQRVRPHVWVLVLLYLGLQQWFFFIHPQTGAFALPFLVTMIALQLPKKWVLPLTIGTLALSVLQTWNQSYGAYVPVTVVMTGGMVLLVRRSIENDQQQALERAQTQQLAEQRRRTQLAADLHDILGQSLTTITVKAQLADRLLSHLVKDSTTPSDRLSAAHQQVTEIAELARHALADVRDVVAATREVSVHAELTAAKDLLHAAGARVAIEDRGIPNAGIEETNAAYVIRESCANIIHHSHAQQVEIFISPTLIRVTDHGPAKTGKFRHQSRSGTGLQGLRQRVEPTGTLTAGPPDPDKPNEGWVVEYQIGQHS